MRSRSVTRLCPPCALLLCAFALLPLAGEAQELPSRAIRIIVPILPAVRVISARG
jgi:tripartite-type tricarboxylate transporter receptor subunit TctC